jgi:hypothetical protein
MYEKNYLKNKTSKELEDMARFLYNHCPHQKKWLKDWEQNINEIHNEINSRKV